MSSPAAINIKETINTLRARQWAHGQKEAKAAADIAFHIREQSRLEDEIMVFEIHLSKLQAQNEGSWLLKKLGF